MRIHLPILLLLAACRGGEPDPGNNAAAEGAETGAVAGMGGEPDGATARTAKPAGLTGLYEGGAGRTKNQLCIIDRASGEARFGLVVWGGAMHSCSGSGSATRSGGSLRLAMAGDSTCTIQARIEGGSVTLPASLPPGCSYYCGARARMAGTIFRRTGNRVADAMKAKDLVGDPLCVSEGAP
jgi:hypothetical protein